MNRLDWSSFCFANGLALEHALANGAGEQSGKLL